MTHEAKPRTPKVAPRSDFDRRFRCGNLGCIRLPATDLSAIATANDGNEIMTPQNLLSERSNVFVTYRS